MVKNIHLQHANTEHYTLHDDDDYDQGLRAPRAKKKKKKKKRFRLFKVGAGVPPKAAEMMQVSSIF